MDNVGEAILWPSEKNYPEFVAVCEGGVLQTYAEFYEAAQPILDQMLASGLRVSKVDPDLDEMVDWCRANFGNVKSKARAAYAGFVVLQHDAKRDAH